MSETTFAQAFMSSMDRKPVKLSSDFVSDPRKYPAQSPYILPKPTHPFPRRQRPDVASNPPPTVSVNLKPMKPTQEPLSLPSQPIHVTVLDLKTEYAKKNGLDVYKIKMLLNKKPCSDLKTLKDLLPDPAPAHVDFTLMIMGGFSSPAAAPSSPAAAPSSPAAAPSTPALASPAIQAPDPIANPALQPVSASTESAPFSERAAGNPEAVPHLNETATEMLKRDEFWADLKDFLVQRLKNESEGERLASVFSQAARP